MYIPTEQIRVIIAQPSYRMANRLKFDAHARGISATEYLRSD